MSLTFAGSLLEKSEDAQLSRDMFGLDVVSRSYEMAPSEWGQFQSQWPRLKADPDFPHCNLVEINPTFTRSYVKVSLTFKGCKDIVTAAQSTAGHEEQTVTLKLPNGVSTELTYLAPVSTWRYARRNYTDKPAFQGKLLAYRYTIRKRAGDLDHDIIYPSGTLTGTTSDLYLAVRNIYTISLECTQVGNCWTIEEKNRGEIIDARNTPTLNINGNEIG